MGNNNYTIDDLLRSLDNLMEVVNVNKVQKDEQYNPLEVFSKSSVEELTTNSSEESVAIRKTRGFLIILKHVDFPGDIIQYSRISEKMFDKKYAYDAVENITQGISDIVEMNFSSILESDPTLKIRVYKLIDHMKLASFQLGEIAQHSIEKYEELSRKLSESEGELKLYKKELKNSTQELKDEQTKIYIQFVTILGIFTAIVFSMFGGLKLLEYTLTALHEIAIWKAVIFFSMVAIATLCMLFSLMRWISIIVDNVSPTQKKSRFKGILSSHFGFTITFVFFTYLIFIAALFSNKEVLSNFQEWVAGISNYLVLGFILLLPVIIFSLFLIVYIYNKKPTARK